VSVNATTGAETLGKLYQGQLPASAAVLFTVTSGQSYIIKTISVTNSTGSSVSGVQLFLSGSAGANSLVGPFTLAAGSTATFSENGWSVTDTNGQRLNGSITGGITQLTGDVTAGPGNGPQVATVVHAPAAGITGTTLAASVVASSLTSAAGGTFGTAAFTASTAYDPSGAAAAALTSAETFAANSSNQTSGTVAAARLPAINLAASGAGGVTGNLPNAQVAGLGSAALEPTSYFDLAGAAATAQSNAETFSANASNLTSGTVAIARLPTGIPNSNLANSTISGIALGSNLDTLTIDATHLTGTSYNGSAPVTIATDATSADTASTIVARDATGSVGVTNVNLSSGINFGTYSVGSNPIVVAVDQSGNVWVANYGSANVTKLSSAGATLGTYSVGTNPYGVAVDQSGNVWVTNSGSSSVTKLSSAGATLGTYSVGSSPVGVAVDQSGNVWVANNGSSSVTKLSSAGATLGTYSVGTSPNGVAVDQSGNVWVANNGSANVTKLSSGSNGVLVPLVQNFSQNTSILLGVAATSVTVSNYSVPVNINGTTYYMRLSSTP
jgi:hypothetical protein